MIHPSFVFRPGALLWAGAQEEANGVPNHFRDDLAMSCARDITTISSLRFGSGLANRTI
jgi:hypothetical protein